MDVPMARVRELQFCYSTGVPIIGGVCLIFVSIGYKNLNFINIRLRFSKKEGVDEYLSK